MESSLSSGTTLGASFMDFGGGRGTDISKANEVFGTPGFCAPELRKGETPTPASDVYTLGRLFHVPPPVSYSPCS